MTGPTYAGAVQRPHAPQSEDSYTPPQSEQETNTQMSNRLKHFSQNCFFVTFTDQTANTHSIWITFQILGTSASLHSKKWVFWHNTYVWQLSMINDHLLQMKIYEIYEMCMVLIWVIKLVLKSWNWLCQQVQRRVQAPDESRVCPWSKLHQEPLCIPAPMRNDTAVNHYYAVRGHNSY